MEREDFGSFDLHGADGWNEYHSQSSPRAHGFPMPAGLYLLGCCDPSD